MPVSVTVKQVVGELSASCCQSCRILVVIVGGGGGGGGGLSLSRFFHRPDFFTGTVTKRKDFSTGEKALSPTTPLLQAGGGGSDLSPSRFFHWAEGDKVTVLVTRLLPSTMSSLQSGGGGGDVSPSRFFHWAEGDGE